MIAGRVNTRTSINYFLKFRTQDSKADTGHKKIQKNSKQNEQESLDKAIEATEQSRALSASSAKGRYYF